MTASTDKRDSLAQYRTVLANERTFLSYTRTAIGIIALALFAFKFAPANVNILLGICILFVAAGIWSFGVHRYRLANASIKNGSYIESEHE